ncbi:MAG: DUF1684 domain-containing protein [Candidatus Odinarchaeota archaeon]
MTTELETQVAELRHKREELINSFLTGQNAPPVKAFEYFPIDEKWRMKGEVKIRKPKPGPVDFKIKYLKIGIINITIAGQPHKFALYQVENELENLYIFIKDGTSGKSTYGLGRFISVIKKGDEYFVDFNAAFTPACGYVEGAGCPFTMESTTAIIEAGEKAPAYH